MDPHRVLGVSPSVSDAELRKAYLQLVMRWHPDRAQNVKNAKHAEKMIREINHAYETVQEWRKNPYTRSATSSYSSPKQSASSSSSSSWSKGYRQEYYQDPRSHQQAYRTSSSYYGDSDDFFKEYQRVQARRSRRLAMGLGGMIVLLYGFSLLHIPRRVRPRAIGVSGKEFEYDYSYENPAEKARVQMERREDIEYKGEQFRYGKKEQ
mmetsp:Transcript_21707/g.37367  ORF Transcript_21707/g.37367 Transcript_21707/m.37367 type:complete len:208 (+) Transcript_21707:102-725(+)